MRIDFKPKLQPGGVWASGAGRSRPNGQAETVDSVHRVGCPQEGPIRERLRRVAGHPLFLHRVL